MNKIEERIEGDPSLGIDELPASQRIRVKFGYWVLGFLAIYTLLSALLYYFAAQTELSGTGQVNERMVAAEQLFRYSKELIPMGTLILGYFFGSRGSGDG